MQESTPKTQWFVQSGSFLAYRVRGGTSTHLLTCCLCSQMRFWSAAGEDYWNSILSLSISPLGKANAWFLLAMAWNWNVLHISMS